MVLLSGPNLSGNELKYVKDCIDTGWVSSLGSYVSDLEKSVSNYIGSKYAVAMSSGTTALHLSLEILNICKDDYVIAPNLTFIATLNAIKYTQATPILLDVDEKSWQIDLDLLVDPGDVIFFDGRREHWVDAPKSKESNSLGRLAVFAIPTHFISDSAYQGFKRSITINIKEFLSRIGIIKLG